MAPSSRILESAKYYGPPYNAQVHNTDCHCVAAKVGSNTARQLRRRLRLLLTDVNINCAVLPSARLSMTVYPKLMLSTTMIFPTSDSQPVIQATIGAIFGGEST